MDTRVKPEYDSQLFKIILHMPHNFKEQSQEAAVDFGFRKVERERKASLVGNIFSEVAAKYDLMNDLMSFGLHRLWKDSMAALVNPIDGAKIIDVAGGTGDIAFRLYRRAKKNGRKIHITVSDINAQMLAEGRKRAVNHNILDSLEWREADGEHLPFPEKHFDHYTIAFGIRNFTNIAAALREAHRVLKPGGQFICMEFAPLEAGMLAKIYDLYSFNVIPLVGKMVTHNPEAYRYLVESIRKFPPPARFSAMISEAGFVQVKARALSQGIVNIHTGWKV